MNEMSKFDHIEEVNKSIDHIEHVEKFNPYHDRLGRFASASGYASFTFRTKDPKKQHMADLAVAREKERAAAAVTKPTPKANLVEGLGEEHAQNMENFVASAPAFIRETWDKHARVIRVADTHCQGAAHCSGNKIHVNADRESQGLNGKEPYETTMHESAHAIDWSLTQEYGARFSSNYKDGLFEKTLTREAEAYVKNRQKELQQKSGGKVSIKEARDNVSRELCAIPYKESHCVSDIFEGATKGNVCGLSGHGKKYWTGYKYYGYTIPGQKVSVEAFAHMFSSTTTNKPSLDLIKKYFPESYGVFTEMLGG